MHTRSQCRYFPKQQISQLSSHFRPTPQYQWVCSQCVWSEMENPFLYKVFNATYWLTEIHLLVELNEVRKKYRLENLSRCRKRSEIPMKYFHKINAFHILLHYVPWFLCTHPLSQKVQAVASILLNLFCTLTCTPFYCNKRRRKKTMKHSYIANGNINKEGIKGNHNGIFNSHDRKSETKTSRCFPETSLLLKDKTTRRTWRISSV